MNSRIRLYLSVLATIALVAQVGPLAHAQEDSEAHLAQNVTSSSPANGESVALDSVAAFSPEGGNAIFDPNNAFAETFSYTGVDSENNALLGLQRPDPRDHPSESVVSPVDEGAPSPSPASTSASEPSPTSEPQPDPETSVASEPSESTSSQGSGSDGSASASESEPDDSGTGPESAEVDRCDVLENATGEDICAIIDGLPLPDECTILRHDQSIEGCIDAIGDVDLLEVITRVAFDDVYLETGTPGCGWAGFTAYNANLQPARGGQSYVVTATTEATASIPQRWQGNLDGSGRGVVYYCPPPGILMYPIKVTFTATVQGVSGVAVRTWVDNPNNCASCIVPGVLTEDQIDNAPDPLDPPVDLDGGHVPEWDVAAFNPYSPEGINVYWSSQVWTDGTVVDKLAARSRVQVYYGEWTRTFSWVNCPECVDVCTQCDRLQSTWHRTCNDIGLTAKGWYFLRTRVKGMIFEDGDSAKKFYNSSGQWVKCGAGVSVPPTAPPPGATGG